MILNECKLTLNESLELVAQGTEGMKRYKEGELQW